MNSLHDGVLRAVVAAAGRAGARAKSMGLAMCMIGLLPAGGLLADENLIALDNGAGIRAVIAPGHGGELASLAVLFNGDWHELLYRAMDYADRPGWRGKAPLLWPAAGVSIHPEAGVHHYALHGELYEMPFHGFARNLPWRVLEPPSPSEPDALVLGISETAETRRYYPFAFDLRVEYRVHEDRLRIEYTVTAGGGNSAAMPFSIGNHITFTAPLIPGPGAAALQFLTTLPDRLLRDANKAFSGAVEPSPFTGWTSIAALGERNAVSLGGRGGAAELLMRDPSGLQLRLVHEASSEPSEPAVRFNLWVDTKDGFFSPEPWIGTQNALNSGAGLVRLPPGETWTWNVDIIPSWALTANTEYEDSR